MAVLDGHFDALAQMIRNGQRVAQLGQLSISPDGPEPLSMLTPSMHLPDQQLGLWHHDLPPSSCVPNRASLMGSSDWDGSQASFGDQLSAYGSGVGLHTAPHSPCSPTISWAPSHGPEMSPAQQLRNDAQAQSSCSTPDSSSCQKPVACRCLCAALHSSSPAAAAAAQDSDEDEACSTPRANMIPSVLPPPGAPRAPRPTARALLPARPFAARAGPCAHLSTEGRSRLQQWLDHMELSLAVPQTPAGPTMDACTAPKVASARTSYRPVLAVSTGPTGAASLSRPGGLDRGRTAPVQPRARSFAGQLSSSSGSSNSSSYSKKRTLPALDTLSLSASGALRMGAAASSASEGVATDDSGLVSVRSSKRRSHDGASGSGPVAAGPASAELTSPGSSTSVACGYLPAPAFDILGLLSGIEQQR